MNVVGLKPVEMSSLREKHKNVLIIVLVINAALFVVEATSGLLANSTALLADSLDMFGSLAGLQDSAFTYFGAALPGRAKAGAVEGCDYGFVRAGVLLEVIHKTISGIVPGAGTMGIIGVLVLLGNAICFLLLYRHRTDDLNMRSTWLCSRNDIIANVSVLVAAAGVAILNSSWPDILIGAAIAGLFLRTALAVLRESFLELRISRSQSATAA